MGINAKLEHWDGFKHIDIAIPDLRVNIEVDGKHHLFSSKQLSADIERSHYSKEEGIDTIRIPNQFIDEDVVGLARSIALVARKRYAEMNEY